MKTRVTELLGCEYPIIQGGMAWVAEHHLAAAVSEAGGLGIIGAASAPAEIVREEIRNWEDRSTCVLFGDGAGAAVVEKSESGILSMVQGSDGAKGGVLRCQNRPTVNPFTEIKAQDLEFDFTHMEGQEVYKFAVRTVPKAIEAVLEQGNVTADEVKYFVLHQANIRIIEAAAKRIGQPLQKFPTNLQKCGNISAGSVPILLDMINKEGKLERGDKIILAGFGAGLTWGAALLSW